jgi:hypothetical protein
MFQYGGITLLFVNDTAYRLSWLLNKLVSNATSRKAILRAIFTKDFPFLSIMIFVHVYASACIIFLILEFAPLNRRVFDE